MQAEKEEGKEEEEERTTVTLIGLGVQGQKQAKRLTHKDQARTPITGRESSALCR